MRLKTITADRQRVIVVIGSCWLNVEGQLGVWGVAAAGRDVAMVVGKVVCEEMTFIVDGRMIV